jgi:hypothetical protein
LYYYKQDYAIVELLWDAAPRTCEALLGCLPDGVRALVDDALER